MKESILNLVLEIIKIKSISANKEETAKVLDTISAFLKEKEGVIERREVKDGYHSSLFSYQPTLNFDYLFLGHVDVVPAKDDLFIPKIEGDKLYARGAYDMKGAVSVMANLFKSLGKDKGANIGLLLVGDEEIGGLSGAEYWTDKLKLKAKVVFDLDSAKPIDCLYYKAKAPYFIKFIAKGNNVHGASPWLGLDANEELLMTLGRIRKHFPYYNTENVPLDEWVDTMHVGKIFGGEGTNIISAHAEAEVDIRLTERISEKELFQIIESSLGKGVHYEILSKGNLVISDTKNEILQRYKRKVEEISGKSVKLKGMNGATDGRNFAKSGSVVITHQSDGEGAHQDDEWVSINGLCELFSIIKSFLDESLN